MSFEAYSMTMFSLFMGFSDSCRALLLHDITNSFLGIVRLKIEVCFISLPLNVQLRLTVVGTDLPEVVERNIFGGMLVGHTFDKE